jgi:hypothetical protein
MGTELMRREAMSSHSQNRINSAMFGGEGDSVWWEMVKGNHT